MSGNRHRAPPFPPPHLQLSSHAAVPVEQLHYPAPALPLRHPQQVVPALLPFAEYGPPPLPDVRNKPAVTDEVVTEPPVAGSATENNGTDAPATGERPAVANAKKTAPNDLAHIERNVSWF